ncbi:hypothetical protein [Tumebacillus flagellatus]|uniref:hypothetical protein n=1 Tax=Tumebacillus flagellatus TaxID=1157490 RepID=UPI001269581E|nr:hypothetical protein [Tumebacillus flagellatus]
MDDRRLQELIALVDQYYSSLTPEQLAARVEATQRVYDQYFGSLPYTKMWSDATHTLKPYQTASIKTMPKNGDLMFVSGGDSIVVRIEYSYQNKHNESEQGVVVTSREGVAAS